MSTQQDGPADEPTGASDTTSAENAAGDAGDTQDDAGASPREYLRGWFTGRLPGDWFTAAPAIEADREEITVVGTLPDPEVDAAAASDAERAAAAEGRIRRFREETRARRVEIAREAEHRFRRKVSWGVTCGGQSEMYTTLSVPVMTRLRQPERRVLDTLVEAGVARSRSDALAWCVRLVGQHEDSWLAELRSALRRVEEVRSEGPQN
jgi:flavin-binding protein dodecin